MLARQLSHAITVGKLVIISVIVGNSMVKVQMASRSLVASRNLVEIVVQKTELGQLLDDWQCG